MAKSKYSNSMNAHSKSAKSSGQIPEAATDVKRSSEDRTPFFSFEHLCERNYQLMDLGKRELKELHNFLKMISKMTWKQIRISDGLEYKTIPRDSLSCSVPKSVPDDARIDEIRVTQAHRIFGFRVESVFNVVWFDPTHGVVPQGKKKRK